MADEKRCSEDPEESRLDRMIRILEKVKRLNVTPMTKAEVNRLYKKMDLDAQRIFAGTYKLSKRERRILYAESGRPIPRALQAKPLRMP